MPPVHPFRVHHRLLAILMLAHVLAILALAASPRLHHWLHPDADDDDHDCAVELFLHGGCGQAPAAIVAPAGPGFQPVAATPEQTPIWVAGIFAVNGTLEHAPPRAGASLDAFPTAAT